ncbi:MAG: bacterial Ig-like domain-containing protein [Clostridia bacterium]|nr:bacterial Ig-like domain-containing protein [Clostridia bacterium]
MKKRIFVSILLVLTLMLTLVSCFDGIANKKVESIQILSGAPSEVTVGETPDLSSLKAKITYNDGETKEVGYADVTISPIDTSKAGKVEYTITYDGYSIPVTITVKAAGTPGPSLTEATLESISLVPGTVMTEFVVGGDFHTNDLQVIAHYSDGTTPTINASKLTITQNIDPDTVGVQTLIVTYKDKSCEVKITVKALEATRISLNLDGFDGEILIGSVLDISQITGTVHYNNSTTAPIANADLTFSVPDTESIGQKTLVATYNGMQTECNVNVLGVKSVLFSGFATKIKPGQTIDLSGLTAVVTATNNKTFNIEASKIDVDWSEFDNTLTTTNRKTTTLKLGYCGTVIDCEITVEATLADAALEKLEYKSGVDTELFVGESFSDADIVFRAVYTYGFSNNNITKDKLTVSGEVNTTAAGVYPITYSLTEGGVTKSCTVEVRVVEPTPTELKLSTAGFTGWVIKGETLDTSSITATLKYNYAGKTTALANADLTISGIDTATSGDKTLTVSYGNVSATVAYTVVTVEFIEVVSGISSNVSLGEAAYEDDNLSVKATLSNGEAVYRGLNSGVSVDASAFNNTVVDTYPVIVSFGGASITVSVSVIEVLEDLVLDSIIIQPGLATSIYAGDAYSYDNIKITAVFNFDITKTYTISDGVVVSTSGSTDEAGTYTVTASYTHEGVTKTASLDVTVVAVVPTSIEINAGSYADKHYIDRTYSTAGITATVYYNKPGYTTTLTAAELDIDIDTSTAGEKTLTVSYGTLTDTATVEVVGIKSVVFEGVDDRYRLNTQIATANIVVAITYNDDTTRDALYNAATMVIPTLDALNESVASETKEYVFSYRGVEYKQNITVYAEFEDATLLSIEYTGATEVFVGGNLNGKLSVKAYYTYGFTRDYTEGVTASALDTSTKGERNITVSYNGKTADVTITVRYPRVTNIVVGSAPIAIKGEAYNFDVINLTLMLENNKSVTASLANLADYGIEAVLDITTAGNQTLTLTANGKSYTHTVTVYEIEKIVINTQGFNNIVQLGSEFSTAGLSEIYVYLVGANEAVIRHADSFDHNVNTAVMSADYTLTATYLGVVSEPVKITVADQNFVISGAEDPASIVAWKNGTYQEQFLDKGYAYVVGDDNPFKYQIRFQMFDIINNKPADTRTITYVGISSVTLDGVAVGAEYVTIDEINHTFDFTEAAIGKTFVITTAHKDYAKYTKSFTVTVVDGYNVHEAIELNLLTNRNFEISSAEKIYQLDVLYEFLANKTVAGIENMTKDEYKAFVDGINAIILHDNFTLETSHFPEKYFFVTEDLTKYLWDHESLFFREFTDDSIYNKEGATPEVFNLYGNYFTVLTYNIPIVADKGTRNNNDTLTNEDDSISSSQLFRFDVSSTIWNNAKTNNAFYHENYVANIYALGTRDDNPMVAVQPETAQLRSRLGIYSFKLASGTYNLYAVNSQAFFNTMTAEYDDLTVNIDYCSFYNAWNNHISTWTNNRIDMGDNKDNPSIHAGYDPTRINISNSFIGKSGGPAILAMVEDPTEKYNMLAGSKPIINIDLNTNIFSYVKGDESWFVSYKATAIAEQLAGFNNFFPGDSTFMTTIGGGSNNFMNMICLFMDAHFNPVTFDGTTSDINGSLTIGGKVIIDMNTTTVGETTYKYGHGGYVDAYRNGMIAAGYQTVPPIFVSDAGGISFTDTATGLYELTNTGSMKKIESADHVAVKGDNLAVFLYNLGLHLGFNEPAIAAEPAPADCTVERVTAPHGYAN